MVREEMFNLWPNNYCIVLALLNEADKENSSLNAPFCDSQQVLLPKPIHLVLSCSQIIRKRKCFMILTNVQTVFSTICML
jgi:hypothetical protein